ncbi:GDP-L-fucose synthase [Skermanella pratensis]|uniref:GDP-L-fucose synthase n=1 Tax=Skermanella pratensis TaxID=2233999 RepID=UPI0024845F2B|nr:GDP-L-fucose synthase [Skermanella pratensis]
MRATEHDGIPPIFPLAGKKVWVAGHRGMVGSAIVRRLAAEDCAILTVSRDAVDLRRQAEVEDWVGSRRPDAIFLAAATVGGIHANSTRPADFIHDNLLIEANVIHAAHLAGVSKLLFLGSSCIYPKLAPQPMTEDALLTGPLEETNQWYALAKIAGIRLCQAYRTQHGCDFISAMPTNLYGINDNFDPMSSHVLPALLRKIHAAMRDGRDRVEVWGTGSPRREFLHVDDLADACLFMMKHYSGCDHLNVGFGKDISIRGLAALIADIVGFDGTFVFDPDKPDGPPRKALDISRLSGLGWKASIGLRAGIASTYDWFLGHHPAAAEPGR